jgi:hypothetical protein
MCPFCFATVGYAAAGAISSGGLAALTVKLFRKQARNESISNVSERRDQDVNEHDDPSENCFAE